MTLNAAFAFMSHLTNLNYPLVKKVRKENLDCRYLMGTTRTITFMLMSEISFESEKTDSV